MKPARTITNIRFRPARSGSIAARLAIIWIILAAAGAVTLILQMS